MLKALYEAEQLVNRYLLLKTLNAQKSSRMMPAFFQQLEQPEESPRHLLARTRTS